MEGRVLGGRYRVVRLRQDGPSADLYDGVHESLEKPVMVSVPVVMREDRAVREFLEQCGRLAQVPDLRIIDFGVEDDRTCFLVTEPPVGPPLEERLRATGTMPAPETIRLGIALLDALSGVHACGVVHGNIRAQGVWWDGRTVRIAGFSFGARLDSQDLNPDDTAPEILHRLPPDIRADVFAVGRLLARIIGPNPPVALDAVILRATTLSVEGRYQTSRAMQRALADLLADTTGPDTSARTFSSGSYGANVTHTSLPPVPANGSGKWIAAAAIALILSVAAYFVLDRSSPLDELEAMVAAKNYGAAEVHALEHFEALSKRPAAVALMHASLATRRANEDAAPYQPDFRLRPVVYDGEVINGDMRHRAVLEIRTVGEGTFEGTFALLKFGVRAKVVGYWSGNHLVMWDNEILATGHQGADYQLFEKTSVYLVGDRLIGLSSAYGSRLEGKRRQN